MTILIFAQQWYPDSVGGSSRVAYEQACALTRRGHTVITLAPRMTPTTATEEQIEGITVYRYGSGQSHILGQSFVDVSQAPAELRRVLSLHRVDLILCHQPTVGFVAAKHHNHPPLVYLFHASVPKEVKFQGITGRGKSIKKFFKPFLIMWLTHMERTILAASERILVLSEYSRTLLAETYGKALAGKAYRVATGIETEVFVPPESKKIVRNQLGIPDDALILLTVRRLVPRMGLAELITAVAPLFPRYPTLRLYIVGEGPLFHDLKKQIDRLHLQEFVTLTGRVRQKDLTMWYQAADCFVLATRAYEGLGIATLEAFSSGLPVLGTPVGATPELLQQVDPRLLFASAEPAAMRAGIEWFLTEGIVDPTIGERARRFVLEYCTWDRAGRELEATLEAITKE